jgi:hypothetical protein
MVFAQIEVKVGPRWYIWGFCTSDTVLFRLEPNRSFKLSMDHFGDEATGILWIDRFNAYKAIEIMTEFYLFSAGPMAVTFWQYYKTGSVTNSAQ